MKKMTALAAATFFFLQLCAQPKGANIIIVHAANLDLQQITQALSQQGFKTDRQLSRPGNMYTVPKKISSNLHICLHVTEIEKGKFAFEGSYYTDTADVSFKRIHNSAIKNSAAAAAWKQMIAEVKRFESDSLAYFKEISRF
jgi:hypothetical protein